MAPETLPSNAEIASQFDLLADLLELDGADVFRLSAYRRASARIGESSASVAKLALDGTVTEMPGIGGTIAGKIVEYVETGDMKALAKLRDKVPAGLVDVMHVPGLGPKTARRLWEELGVSNLDELRAAAEEQKLRELSGLGPKSEERVLAALAKPAVSQETGRVLLGRVLPVVRALVAELAAHPACDRVSEAGSVRRRAEMSRDVDLIATSSDAPALLRAFVEHERVAEVAAHGPTKATVVSYDGFRFDLRVVPPECFGNLLQHFTGSKDHNIALREDAVRQGLSVSEYGIEHVESGEVFTATGEAEVYERLGYAWIPPELRENRGELEAARDNRLPKLVDVGDIRGDLHMHTTYSDGRATLDEMVAAAKAFGHSYIAICDHAGRLAGGALERQAEEITALDVKGIQVLRGVEVDIRRDGTVNMDDELLAGLDWVMASIHSGFDASRGELTKRMCAAMENPHVDCIGHPTGRKLNKRAAYDLDFDAVFATASDTGTFLEVNAQPDRLDLMSAHARAATMAGVKIVVSTDAHRTHELENLELGVFQARRGWLTKDDVVNTRTWAQVKKLKKS